MADDTQRPIIIKRIKKVAGGHHGGAWKIAYADFVTAMMAFFLLMWLLGSTTKGELQGISDYFRTPLKVALSGGSGSGDATNPLASGGGDMTRRDSMQMQRGALPEKKPTIKAKDAQAELDRLEGQRLKALKARLEAVIEANPVMRQYRDQLLIDITSEGQGAVADHIGFGPNTLNDGRVNFIIIALAPGDRIIGMKMNNRGALCRTCDGIFDNFVGVHRDCGLALARPGTIQSDFKPYRILHTYFLTNNK